MSETVILLHGLGRTKRAMHPLAVYLEQQNYSVVNLDYYSLRYPIEVLVDQVSEQINAQKLNPQSRLHFVGQSLGAIITHFYLKKYPPACLGRVVALGPPFHGSGIVDHLGRYAWFRKIYGPAAMQLTTDTATGVWEKLGVIDYELGVLAGDRYTWFDWYFANYWLKQPNDGKVEVASTRVPGTHDHLILPVNHVHFPTFPTVHKQVVHFLRYGYFDRSCHSG